MLAYLACVEQTAPAFAQFGLPRGGLYAVAAWLAHGAGLKCIEGGWINQFAPGKLVTIEAVRPEYLIEGLAYCRSLHGIGFIQLRDPYNWLASLDEGLSRSAVVWNGSDPPLRRWLQHAQLCRTEEWLDYNRWFADAEYRRGRAEHFGFQQNREGALWQGVPNRGGGSSFDGTQFEGRAGEMKVGERWRRFEHDARWRAQFDDEIVSLTRELFGMERPW
jgi:hypothetical protein